MNPDIKEKGGEKKNLKMEEETLVAFGIILVLFLRRRRRRRQQRLKNRRRKEWVRPIFQQEARRVHGQYNNLVRELRLGDREYYFR